MSIKILVNQFVVITFKQMMKNAKMEILIQMMVVSNVNLSVNSLVLNVKEVFVLNVNLDIICKMVSVKKFTMMV